MALLRTAQQCQPPEDIRRAPGIIQRRQVIDQGRQRRFSRIEGTSRDEVVHSRETLVRLVRDCRTTTGHGDSGHDDDQASDGEQLTGQ